MDTSTPVSARRVASDTSGLTKFTRGQTVVLPGGVLGTIVEPAVGLGGELVRVNFLDGHAYGTVPEGSVRSRAEFLHHARAVMDAIAHDLADAGLRDAVTALAAPLSSAADRANELDGEVA